MANNADQIRNIAKDVYRVLGSGFSEDVYDRAMQVGLRLAKFRYEGQKVLELKYKDHCVGEGYPDLTPHCSLPWAPSILVWRVLLGLCGKGIWLRYL
jgi:hypothetical protein